MIFSRRKILIISITILMTVLLSTIFGYSNTNFKPQYGITSDNVNLRKQANLDSSSIVKVIPTNTNLKIVGTIENFSIVQLPSNEVGLISSDYIKELYMKKSLLNSKEYYKFCKDNNIIFVNTSRNRDKVLNDLLRKISKII